MDLHKCPDPVEFGRILELPESDPLLRELNSCPSCRAMIAAYGTFLQPGEPPAEAKLDVARAHLAAVLHEEAIAQSAAREGIPQPVSAPKSPRNGERARARNGLFGSSWPLLAFSWLRHRFVPALATLALVAIVLFGINDRKESPETARLRESAEATQWQLLKATVLTDGDIEFAWEPYQDADAYEVAIYRESLDEIVRLGPVSETSARLVAADLLGDVPAGMRLLWRVVAFRQGDVVADSPVKPLLMPGP